jgi:hypothetical protein
MAHRFGTHVRLALGKICRSVPLDRVNQLLLESRHLCHLKIPRQLTKFDSTGTSFTSNPHFLSLETSRIFDGDISLKLLEGLALNTGLRHFILKFSVVSYEISRTALLETMTYLFGQVLPKCCSLSALTLALQDYCGDESCSTRERQDVFCKEIVDCIASSRPKRAKARFGSLSSINITRVRPIDHTNKELVLPPNETWDGLVSPSLVLAWCGKEHCSKRLQPPGIIVAAVSQINQNVVYRKTSRVAPRDSRTANAGVIYYFIYLFHPAFGIQTQAPFEK